MAVNTLFVKLALQNSQFKRGLKQSSKDLDKFANAATAGVSGLGALAGVGALAFGAKQIAEAAWNLGELGAQTIQVRDSFEELARQTGGSADEMLAAIKRATGGTVSEYDAMLAANRGMMLGLGANAEQWGQLVEVARFKARAMGIDVTQALNDITTGIGRESRMILDNLGIVLDLDSVMSQYADTLGKTGGELSAFERKQAIVNSVIAEGQGQIQEAGGIVTTYADDIERMTAAVDDAKRALGEALAPAIADVADATANALPRVVSNIELLGAALSGTISIQDAWTAAAEAQRMEMTQGAEAAAAYAESVARGAEAARIRVGAAQEVVAGIKQEISAVESSTDMLDAAKEAALGLLQADLDAAEAALKLAQAELTLATASDTAATATGALMSEIGGLPAAAAKATGALEDEAKAAANAAVAYGLLSESIAAKAQAEVSGEPVNEPYDYEGEEEHLAALESIDREREENEQKEEQRADDYASAWESAIDKHQRALDNLRSAVSAALTPTSVTAEDMGLAEMGEYIDKWDENARRFDAIAQRGFAELTAHPDWASVLKIPDDVLQGGEAALKAWASSMADQVRDLSRPDLINIDAAADAVEAFMQQEAAKEITIDLVVAEIAARGGLSEDAARKKVLAAYGMEEPEVPVSLTLAEGGLDTITEEMKDVEIPVTFTSAEGVEGEGVSMLPVGLTLAEDAEVAFLEQIGILTVPIQLSLGGGEGEEAGAGGGGEEGGAVMPGLDPAMMEESMLLLGKASAEAMVTGFMAGAAAADLSGNLVSAFRNDIQDDRAKLYQAGQAAFDFIRLGIEQGIWGTNWAGLLAAAVQASLAGYDWGAAGGEGDPD